jgi:phosphoserine aminotransferase
MSRVFNFGAGPATLPVEVLEQARDEWLDFKGSGMSILESSHRGREYDVVHQEALQNVRQLLDAPESHGILLLQGGATLQFDMVPMNLLAAGAVADYIHTGSWAKKAIQEARRIGRVQVAADTSAAAPARMPDAAELKFTPGAAYVHLTSNETIEGTQWKRFPRPDAPLVADMSSDIMSRPVDVSQFGLIYAGAQKNLGPAGVTLVIIRHDLAERAPAALPGMLQYRTHLQDNSLHNTPPCFAIYILMLVTRWVIARGGLPALARQNAAKAARLYQAIDASGFYRGTAHPEHRSEMNVTFRLPSEALEDRFIKDASARGFKGLKGHRSVGGIRASIYNAFPPEGVDRLVEFMREFERTNG